MSIHFIQYLMPDGKQLDIEMDRSENIEQAAEKLISQGAKFEVEMLSDYKTISITCEIEDLDGEIETLAHILVENGPAVPKAVDQLVSKATVALAWRTSI